MTDDINYKNNPLHGVNLKTILTEMVDHYGFEILFAYLNINCFKTKPSIMSSVKFLKKTDWAREKVEGFYLYKYKNLPRVSSEQFTLSPRDRIVPEDQSPGEPAELSFEDADLEREKREKKSEAYGKGYGSRPGGGSNYSGQRGSYSGSRENNRSHHSSGYEARKRSSSPVDPNEDPWANWKKKSED